VVELVAEAVEVVVVVVEVVVVEAMMHPNSRANCPQVLHRVLVSYHLPGKMMPVVCGQPR